MNVLGALGQLTTLLAKVPPEIRGLIVDLVRDIVHGKSPNEVQMRAARAAIRLAAMRGYRP